MDVEKLIQELQRVQRHRSKAQDSIVDRIGASERTPQQAESPKTYAGESWRQKHEDRAAEE
jgi:hypothetical protein